MTTAYDNATAYWMAEMVKAEQAANTAKTRAAAKKANYRMMECRMAMRSAMQCSDDY